METSMGIFVTPQNDEISFFVSQKRPFLRGETEHRISVSEGELEKGASPT
jgi:hypothetical protein